MACRVARRIAALPSAARHGTSAGMIHRRRLLSGGALLALPPATAFAATEGFESFLEGVRLEARRLGVSQPTIRRALGSLRPNERVLELDRRQPEGLLSWEQYRERAVTATRIEQGRRGYAENRTLLEAIAARSRVSPRVIVAIWGVETGYGSFTGGFGVVEALATLAWDGRRSSFFRAELLAALRILDAGDIAYERMRGSWAGAMGQPQFMPTSYERMAVDFDGDGRRDIWDSRADALGSIANYFARNGWREGEPWGFEIAGPPGFDVERADTDTKRSLAEWARLGYRPLYGNMLAQPQLEAQLVLPTRGSGQAFLGLHNLRVIRRYNSPVNYGLVVGLLADRVA
jgi:membrane-bound lytic murein transglycosylase B